VRLVNDHIVALYDAVEIGVPVVLLPKAEQA
jgi:lipoprotein-anchoring transpeptidase ErfK/SrfK